MSSSGEVSPSNTPAGTPHAPKYGTVIPNRIFVGGIAANTTEAELKQYFATYGAVKDSKIIADRAGVSKGYGFITFETQEDAEKIIKKEADNLIFKERKLNIGPAIRKQAFARLYEQNLSPGAVFFTNGVPYYYHNGMAVFPHQEGGGYPVQAQPQQTPYVMVPQPQVYLSPQYAAYQNPPAATPAQYPPTAGQWRWAQQGATPITTGAAQANQYMYPTAATVQAMTPEMMYGQPPPQAYQPDLAEAAMMEAAPAEGSMVMEHNLQVQQRYVEQQGMTSTTATIYASALASQDQVTTGPIAAKQMHVIDPHKPGMTVKRPFPNANPRTLSTVAYTSPRATPPAKIMATQAPNRHSMSKSNGTPINIMTKDVPEHNIIERIHVHHEVSSGHLTPPPTPDVVVP